MGTFYGRDLAYIHATAFGGLAQGATSEIVRLLKSAAIPIRHVVDVGCGAGVLTAAMVEAGFNVTGVDNSADLLEIAAAAVPGAHFVKASIYGFQIPACEAIVALGEPLRYHSEGAEADRLVRNFFQQVSGVLPSGGLFIFDVIETGEPPLTGRFWSSGSDWAVLVDTSEDQASRTLVRRIETFRDVGGLYRRGKEIHRVRLFDTHEVSSVLAGNGFTTETAQSYGGERLPTRRRAFICTRL